VINSIPDNVPYSGDYPYNTGNTLVVNHADLYLVLGHLKEGSIRAKEGGLLKKGDYVANAGNSGYSERPHLHFQLIKSATADYWKGTGINMTFRGKNLYKNRLIHIDRQ
jgi:murein DD-endopeptidase MepM/ murein hydrolase activator NlpD